MIVCDRTLRNAPRKSVHLDIHWKSLGIRNRRVTDVVIDRRYSLTIPNLTQVQVEGGKYGTSGLRVMESYFGINLYPNNTYVDQLSFTPVWPYPTRRLSNTDYKKKKKKFFFRSISSSLRMSLWRVPWPRCPVPHPWTVCKGNVGSLLGYDYCGTRIWRPEVLGLCY